MVMESQIMFVKIVLEKNLDSHKVQTNVKVLGQMALAFAKVIIQMFCQTFFTKF